MCPFVPSFAIFCSKNLSSACVAVVSKIRSRSSHKTFSCVCVRLHNILYFLVARPQKEKTSDASIQLVVSTSVHMYVLPFYLDMHFFHPVTTSENETSLNSWECLCHFCHCLSGSGRKHCCCFVDTWFFTWNIDISQHKIFQQQQHSSQLLLLFEAV